MKIVNLTWHIDDPYQQKPSNSIQKPPVIKWLALREDPTLADAILDRVIHRAHRIQTEGESQRKIRGKDDK